MIYLDYNATTPIDPRVAQVMLPYIHGHYGNPSSSHSLGQTAKHAVEKARAQVAGMLGCSSEEILFTSGGSESNNMAIKGTAYTLRYKGDHIITSSIEHPAVLNPCTHLEEQGYHISYLPVDANGIVRVDELEGLITDRTVLVSVMLANNETGTIQPLEEISRICRKHHILLHSDASQAVGKIPVRVDELGVDMLTIAGHKLYAPKGIGALYIRKGVVIEPLIHGAGHELGRRAGTENVIFDVALGKACEITAEYLNESTLKDLTDYFFSGLQLIFGETIHLNGDPLSKLPNTLNISFLGMNGSALLAELGNDVAASTGSACHSGLITISPVLKAMGIPYEIARGAVRFSLGRNTNKDEIDEILHRLEEIQTKLEGDQL
ncbi:MAG: Cysteine desulfurase [Neobacillus sp.]|nr:Cysteine desulfurase [Neobacillus sp.]